MYSSLNALMILNQENISNPEKVNRSQQILANTTARIPSNHIDSLMGDFNVQFGKERKF